MFTHYTYRGVPCVIIDAEDWQREILTEDNEILKVDPSSLTYTTYLKPFNPKV